MLRLVLLICASIIISIPSLGLTKTCDGLFLPAYAVENGTTALFKTLVQYDKEWASADQVFNFSIQLQYRDPLESPRERWQFVWTAVEPISLKKMSEADPHIVFDMRPNNYPMSIYLTVPRSQLRSLAAILKRPEIARRISGVLLGDFSWSPRRSAENFERIPIVRTSEIKPVEFPNKVVEKFFRHLTVGRVIPFYQNNQKMNAASSTSQTYLISVNTAEGRKESQVLSLPKTLRIDRDFPKNMSLPSSRL